jgi:hypothetical protein
MYAFGKTVLHGASDALVRRNGGAQHSVADFNTVDSQRFRRVRAPGAPGSR